MLLSQNNIMAELSYAYLHAVAARAGFACEEGNRHEDGIGVDAKLRVKERFAPDSTLTNFTVDVQLKATRGSLPLWRGSTLIAFESRTTMNCARSNARRPRCWWFSFCPTIWSSG